jgi:hypothetical protein
MSQIPRQEYGPTGPVGGVHDIFDMREHLRPRRLTMVMWDHTFLTRHVPGESFADYDRVLDEAIERGYNTIRIDPAPQAIDLSRPEAIIDHSDFDKPYIPWTNPKGCKGPLGQWLIEFMGKLQARKLNYILSAWWWPFQMTLGEARSMDEAVERWLPLLRQWEKRFGFEGLLFVDLVNEFPYFLHGYIDQLNQLEGGWYGPAGRSKIAKEINAAMDVMRREFPPLRFTVSMHGDVRWLDVDVELDCLDVHFYADADRRWDKRTRFGEFMPRLYSDADWHAEFSDRCIKSHAAMAPMYRARQRSKLAQFARWAAQRGTPLTTTESWASWFYLDSPHLDWGWLLEWAAWSVQDAIDMRMWGWTPHNYCQLQFANWKDVAWHRRLTQRFLTS